MQLLKVMSKLSQPGTMHLPYFLLCREIGVRAVDGMIKGRVLNLHWTDPLSHEREALTRREVATPLPSNLGGVGVIPSPINIGGGSTVGASSEDGDMMMNPVNMSTRELGQIDEEDENEVIGPKLMPLTPIMRYAMREVVLEYEDVRTVSDYASFTDVEEY